MNTSRDDGLNWLLWVPTWDVRLWRGSSCKARRSGHFALSRNRQVWPSSKVQKMTKVQSMQKAWDVFVVSGCLISGKGVSENPSDVSLD